MTTPLTDPLVGASVAQYQVLARLGGGGMGVVYSARDTRLGRRVALKFLPPQWSYDEHAKQRFVREAQAASATDHRNICTIHDIGSTDDGRLFIVMAHYDGQTLKQRLESGPLDIDQAVEIAAQAAEGLTKAHAQGVVHRDIKPGNLMIVDGTVKILDFGLAKFAAAIQLTVEHSTLGTAGYMSPEQVRGEDADVRSDVWALGVVLYEMLAGHPPFQGAYAEAVSYAIRNETPAPLRAAKPGVPEALEQIVFRALHKEPAIRFQNARELARALRLFQGHTLPQDLLSEPVTVPVGAAALLTPHPRRRRAPAVAAGLAFLVAVPAGYLWMAPVERTPVVIAPMSNQTGDGELDAYRLALTQAMILALQDSPSVSAVPYPRLLGVLGRFLSGQTDLSSPEVVRALSDNTGVSMVVVPSLAYEGGAWRARAEFRDTTTPDRNTVFETEPVVSSLARDTAYQLTAELAEAIEAQFTPWRSGVMDGIRGLVGAGAPGLSAPIETLDAAKTFEEGVRLYEDLEYAAARRAFMSASEQEPRNPLPLAWASRAALHNRQDREARDAADRALMLLGADASPTDVRFVQAVASEARRNYDDAEGQYRELTGNDSVNPWWRLELAGFLDRRARTDEAIAVYRESLTLDPRLLRAHLELCRLHSPSRLNERATAMMHGQTALEGYRALGARGGEGQSLLCLADALRVGSEAERAEALAHAETARTIFEETGLLYNRVRAEYYIALVTAQQGRFAESIPLAEEALERAREAENAAVEPLLLMNIGAAHVSLGSLPQAAEFYQQGSAAYQRWGDEARAAQVQANRGAMLIDYLDPEEGIREVQNALGVFRKLGDRSWEVFCLQVLAAYHRMRGFHTDAERELNQALAIAAERGLTARVPGLTTDLAQSRMEMGDYAGARELLVQGLGDGTGPWAPETRIHLAHLYLHLGDSSAAEAEIATVAPQVRGAALRSSLALRRGELAYDSGRTREARQYFGEASALWTNNEPEPASIEARAYLGLLDALDTRADQGRARIRASLDMARRRGRLSLETRCRLLLAQLEVRKGRYADALAALDAILVDEPGRSIGPELRAEGHYWRSQALAGRGDAAAARSESEAARAAIDALAATVPEQYRQGFALRPLVRRVIG